MTAREWKTMVALLKAKAEAGDCKAQWELGSWLQDGFVDRRGNIIIRPDARAAVLWFRRSAIGGNASGQINLGVCLSDGQGVRRDDVEALFWLKRALHQGDMCAANNIACIYRARGDHRRALFWYKRAVEMGDKDALVEVGIRYYAGQGVRQNPEHAVRCFRRAIKSREAEISEAGREKAMFHLGIAYHEGKGVKHSDGKALDWLSKANHDDDNPAAREVFERIERNTHTRF